MTADTHNLTIHLSKETLKKIDDFRYDEFRYAERIPTKEEVVSFSPFTLLLFTQMLIFIIDRGQAALAVFFPSLLHCQN